MSFGTWVFFKEEGYGVFISLPKLFVRPILNGRNNKEEIPL